MARKYILSVFYTEGEYSNLYKFHVKDHRGKEHIIALEAPDPFSACINLLNKGYTILSIQK